MDRLRARTNQIARNWSASDCFNQFNCSHVSSCGTQIGCSTLFQPKGKGYLDEAYQDATTHQIEKILVDMFKRNIITYANKLDSSNLRKMQDYYFLVIGYEVKNHKATE